MEILSCYDIQFNPTVKDMLDKYVVLPGEFQSADTNNLQQKFSSQLNCQVNLDPKYLLSLQASTTWKILRELYQLLKEFLKPFSDDLDFLVYFNLHKCEMFNDYLKCQLTEMSNVQCCAEEQYTGKTLLVMSSKQSNIGLRERVTQVRTCICMCMYIRIQCIYLCMYVQIYIHLQMAICDPMGENQSFSQKSKIVLKCT